MNLKLCLSKFKYCILFKKLWIVAAVSLFNVTLLKAELQNADLVFVMEGESSFSDAISRSTSFTDTVSFIHVGIIEKKGNDIYVIEASPEEGVREISLSDFLKDTKNGVVFKRLELDFALDFAINKAKEYLGQPYDWYYLPDNGKMYCSELVYEAYRYPSGEKIFMAKPMNFKDSEGRYPQFWIDLFKKLETDIPQDVLGTNPNDLAKNPLLMDVEYITK